MIPIEAGKNYWVVLPGFEECSPRKVISKTERTVVLTNVDHEEYIKRHWNPQVQRFSLHRVDFIEELKKEDITIWED